jgi:hypothetical protein
LSNKWLTNSESFRAVMVQLNLKSFRTAPQGFGQPQASIASVVPFFCARKSGKSAGINAPSVKRRAIIGAFS